MLTLLGVAVIVVGFALRFNPLLVVVAAALTAGKASGQGPLEVLAAIGVLERCGLQEQARMTIQRLKGASAGKLLLTYLLLRQATSALGLTHVAGHAQTVRPLVAPMAEAAAEGVGPVDDDARERIKAMSAATDNVGLFFGEDIFMAIGSILLIVGFLDQSGITVEPLHLSVWAIPTAIAAFIVHGARLLLFDRKLTLSKTGADA